MSAPHPRWSSAIGLTHPAVVDRRIREFLLIGLSGLVPLVIALGVAVEMPKPNFLLVSGVLIGALGVTALVVSTRLEVTVLFVALYLGLLDGPVKLLIGHHEATAAVRNVLILAVSLGAVMRLLVSRERVTLPPLSGWVLAFVGLVLLEAFNPKTGGILHALGGFRQELQWVPFFFFGYLLVRSKERLRKLFLIVGVIGLANGVVSTYQTLISPAQLAAWGPGYAELVNGTEGPVGDRLGGRTYSSEGVGRVRPMALGSDTGFGGGVGVLALPFSLALLATWRSRRRWVAALLALAAMVAVVTGLGRLAVIGAGISVVSFAVLSSLGGRRVTRALGALLAIVVLAIPLGALFVSVLRSGTFSRYEGIASGNIVSTSVSYKESTWEKIPHVIGVAPFGVGLGSVGAVGAFGGANPDKLEGHSVSADTQYNLVTDEVGGPGLLLWVALSIYVVVLVVRRLRRVADGELTIALAGTFAPFIALIAMGFSGPFIVSAATGPYFWFAIGVAAYWFAGPGRNADSTIAVRP